MTEFVFHFYLKRMRYHWQATPGHFQNLKVHQLCKQLRMPQFAISKNKDLFPELFNVSRNLERIMKHVVFRCIFNINYRLGGQVLIVSRSVFKNYLDMAGNREVCQFKETANVQCTLCCFFNSE